MAVMAVLETVAEMDTVRTKPSKVQNGQGTNAGMPKRLPSSPDSSGQPPAASEIRTDRNDSAGRHVYSDSSRISLASSRRANRTPQTNARQHARIFVAMLALKAAHSATYIPRIASSQALALRRACDLAARRFARGQPNAKAKATFRTMSEIAGTM